MIWLLTTLAAIAPFAIWGLRVYLARINQVARDAERKAGADASQVEAQNAENDRIVAAANAGAAINGMQPKQVDPNDRDGA